MTIEYNAFIKTVDANKMQICISNFCFTDKTNFEIKISTGSDKIILTSREFKALCDQIESYKRMLEFKS